MKPRQLLQLALIGAFLCLPIAAVRADDVLPAKVSNLVHVPLAKVGSGNYRKLGFKVYTATLWAPEGVWSAEKPFALEVVYARKLSRDTVFDAVMEDIRDQGVADEATLKRWEGVLTAAIPAVEENDTIIAVSRPGKQALLFHNGTQIASIDEKPLSNAFFNIWLGDKADESLKRKLLGKDD
ncbi:MAG: chalcone isomerase family protein [Pseudomonadota bacterium]|nr:chalcone isomerase family protein [Pseudomonadota bacterium]